MKSEQLNGDDSFPFFTQVVLNKSGKLLQFN